jgi:transposase
MDLFDNEDPGLDLDLYDLSLILNGESDSDSGPENEPPFDSNSEAPSPKASTETGKKSHYHTVGTRMLALTRKRDGIPIPHITLELSMSKSAINKLQEKAISRRWSPNPVRKQVVEPHHVDDAPRSGRPKTSTATAELILKTMLKNSTTRGWSCKRIASEVSAIPGWQVVSPSTVYRVLIEHGYGVYKRTVKPRLTKEQMEERLKWCLEHAHWTLEDWKNVIWTDETSVQLGGVRGRRRVWRKKDEAYHDHVIMRRWKGFKEFMWWSCFSYDKKGPWHI